MSKIQSICIYCGSSNGHSESYKSAAMMLGRALADAGIRLVYGGGTRGIMGAVASATRDNGGEVIGIIPEFLIQRERHNNGHLDGSEVILTKNMHERKHLMFEKSDAFIALPGGIGTLEELVEILTWSQLGRHNKPILMADIDGFWSPLISLFDHMADEGFFHSAALVRPLVVSKAEQILPVLLDEAKRISSAGEFKIAEQF